MISTPCINICVMDRKLCIGCGRTLDEIASWGTMSEAERRGVIALLPWRLAAIEGEHDADTKPNAPHKSTRR